MGKAQKTGKKKGVQRTKKAKPTPVAPESVQEKEPQAEYIWIYAHQSSKRQYFEFHPSFQSHLEQCFVAKKKETRLLVHGNVWTINVTKKRKITDDGNVLIKRILNTQDSLKKHKVVGVSNQKYGRPVNPRIGQEVVQFNQEDKTCPICQYTHHMPLKLNCGHVFCFPCFRDLYATSKSCPMCRCPLGWSTYGLEMYMNDLTLDITAPDPFNADCDTSFPPIEDNMKGENERRGGRNIGQPAVELDPNAPEEVCPATDVLYPTQKQRYYWIYEDHIRPETWWRYDVKTERYIENAFVRGYSSVDVSIYNHRFNLQFDNLIQMAKTTTLFPMCAPRKFQRIPVNWNREKLCVRGINGVNIGHQILADS